MRDRHQPRGSELVDEVDRAPVGEPPRDEVAELGQRVLGVERRPEQRARLGEEPEPLAPFLRAPEEPRVVDGGGGAGRQLLREREVVVPEAPAALGRGEGDRAERTPACDERDRHQRVNVEPVEDLRQLRMLGARGSDHLGGHLRQELRLARAQHRRHAARRIRVRGHALADLPGPADLLRVGMRHREPLDRAVACEHVDRAPVGQLRHDERGEVDERLLVLERRGEERARLGEERQPLLRLALPLDETDLGDRERDPVRDQLEHPQVVGREMAALLGARVDDPDHLVLHDQRDRDERPDPACVQHRADELDLVEVVDEARRARRRDGSGEPFAERDRRRLL